MKWKVSYSKEAKNFIETRNIWNEARNGIRKFFQKMKGEDVNINLKKLVGNWEGYYRIRIGKMRLIFKVHKENKEIFVEKVDYRGDVYK